MQASFPPEMQETFTNLENQANPWGFSADTRADWSKGMSVTLMCDHPGGRGIVFRGVRRRFRRPREKDAQAMARVLQRAGVDFAILGPEEACNGDLARRAGNEYLAADADQAKRGDPEQVQAQKNPHGLPALLQHHQK